MAAPKTKTTKPRRSPPPPIEANTTKGEMIRLRITLEEKERFNSAAVASGRTLSNWIRWLANRETTEA